MLIRLYMRESRGEETGGSDLPPPPLENHSYKRFLSNTGPDPLEIHNLAILSQNALRRDLNGKCIE